MKNLVYFISTFLLFLALKSSAVVLSPKAQFSLLTCGPGQELYSLYGHSAIRLKDPLLKIDEVYNYGTFDFNTPNFYVKFTRGKLNYKLAREGIRNFMWTYQHEKRYVEEQKLLLTQEQKQGLFEFLEKNALPQNCEYKYDFFFDNCSSRIGDVLQEVLGDGLKFPPAPSDSTFRQHTFPYMEESPWIELAIDYILGIKSDQVAKNGYEQFLPDQLQLSFANATLDGHALVERITLLYKPDEVIVAPTLLSPTFLFYALLMIAVVSSYYKKAGRWAFFLLDMPLFAVHGLMGLLLVFMWLGTDHQATYANLNMLWTSPLYLVLLVALLMKKKTKKVLPYLIIAISALTLLYLIGGLVFPQSPPNASYPLMLLLVIRLFFLRKSLIEDQQQVNTGDTAS